MEKILLISFSIGFFASLTIIFNNRNWHNPKFWLGMLILGLSWLLFDEWGRLVGLEDTIPFFKRTYFRFLTTLPISFWLYFNGLANNNKVQFGDFEKFLFAVLGLEIILLSIPIFYPYDWVGKTDFLSLRTLNAYLCFFNSAIIIFKSKKILIKLKEQIRKSFLAEKHKLYNWLNESFIIYTILFSFSFLYINFAAFETDFLLIFNQYAYMLFASTIIYVLIRFLSLKEILHDLSFQSEMDSLNFLTSPEEIIEPTLPLPIEKNENPPKESFKCQLIEVKGKFKLVWGIEPIKSDKDSLAKLVDQIYEQKLFRVKRLNIDECAKSTDVPQKEISRLVNQYLELSFSDLINIFRIEEFKNKMRCGEGKKYSLIHIALDCGFSSKSNFYYTFKKLTGTSPNQLLNQKGENH